ncbi:MAG: PIN domain-containing protein, partial [Chloroflexota bacterium]
MTFFIDANVIVYSGSDDPERHAACEEILAAVARGAVEGRTSTAVLEEVWHLELTGRAGAIAGISERAYAALAPLLPVTDEIFRRALGLRVR